MDAYAKVIADSVTEDDVRLTTFEVCFWRPVLAEFNTHRVFSRNSASSRAIPVRKQLARVWREPAGPISWPAEQKGMQGGEELSAEQVGLAKRHWLLARDRAAEHASELVAAGVHKSVVNRLLEPFMMHTAVVTATAWENFFEQRCSPLAQPEIRVAAEAMWDAYKMSDPIFLEGGEWHTPYVEPETEQEIAELADTTPEYWQTMARVSAARCARVSYLTQDGKRDIQEDLKLYARLTEANPPHWSPLEHVATPWLENVQDWDAGFNFNDFDGRSYAPATEHLPRVGNLLGWRSLRTTVEAVNDLVTFA